MKKHKSVETFETSSYTTKDRDKIIERINFIFETTKDRLLPTFDAIEQEAEVIQENTMKTLNETCSTHGMNEYDCYSASHCQALHHYTTNKEMKRELLNHQTAFLFHRFEKDCQEIFKNLIVKDGNILINELIKLNIQTEIGSSWHKINNELRLVTNVIKHGEGPSLDKLKEERGDLFISSFHYLINSSIEISLDELTIYVEEIKKFWIDFFEKYTISKTLENVAIQEILI